MEENEGKKPTKPTTLESPSFKTYKKCPYCKNLGKKHSVKFQKCQYKCGKCGRYFTANAQYTRIQDKHTFELLIKEYLSNKKNNLKINLAQILSKYPDISKSALYRKRNYIKLIEKIIEIARRKSDIRRVEIKGSSVFLTLVVANFDFEYLKIELISSASDKVEIAVTLSEVEPLNGICKRINPVYEPTIIKDQFLKIIIPKTFIENFSSEFLKSIKNSHLRNEAWTF